MMADNDLPDQQDHIEYLELCQVWKSIGLSLEDEVLQEWRTNYPVNIAVLDSGVCENHEAFTSILHPSLSKVLQSKSFIAGNVQGNDDVGHGTFCAGIAAGYPIPSPKKVKDPKVQDCAERCCKLLKLSDESKRLQLEDIFQDLISSGAENTPFVGVAPFSNIFSYKVIDDNNIVDENALASALQDIIEHNSSTKLEDKVHIVSMSLSAHYHDDVRSALYDILNSDIIVVAAACNMGQRNNYCNGNIWFPARFGNVISVGSHDNHGQPCKMSSIGREVDFLAPGEEIWGPSISVDRTDCIEKDEGTSMSAAIVSGIIALVLAFVHKEKGPDARSKISNNPVMKEILGNMATRRGQHDNVEGYGSLKPLRVFGYGAHILWRLVGNLSSASPYPDGAENSNFDVKVSKFILSETALSMHSPQNKLDFQNVEVPYNMFYGEPYPFNYHEDEDNTNIEPCTEECLMKCTLDALNYLRQRKLTSHVKVFNLTLPVHPLKSRERARNDEDQLRKLLMCKDVLPIIEESRVEVIEQLIFPNSMANIYASDLCRFVKRLSESILSGLKSIVVPCRTPLGVLCRIAEILNGRDVTIYAKDMNVETDMNVQQECGFPQIVGVKVITSFLKCLKDVHERVGFINPLNMTYDGDLVCKVIKDVEVYGVIRDGEPDPTNDDLVCVDEILAINFYSLQSEFHDAKHFYSASFDDLELHKVTVAILGDAIDIHHKEINNKINPGDNLKCFTVPSGGTVEKDRYLGTLCASIIAGNSKGISPFVDLVYATVINAEVKTKPEWVISALEWINSAHSNVDIVVIPLGFAEFNLGLFKIINRLSKNMVIVCAAGNSSETIRPGKICYPARYGDVVCVGSHSILSKPSLFSPQGREIDLLALGENVEFNHFAVNDDKLLLRGYTIPDPEIIPRKSSLSGTCVATACAAAVIAQIVALALQRGFERQKITNNTVIRELLKHLTCNFSHHPQDGHGWLNNFSESELFKNPDYFKKIVDEILSAEN